MLDSSINSWENSAFDWINHTDNNDYSNYFLLPETIKTLGNVQGKRVLDLGCGEGKYSRELAKNGAEVIGIDGSKTLVETAIARNLINGLNISYYFSNANNLEMINNDTIDIVLASMVLMDVEDFSGTIKEIYRVLKPNGKTLITILHPCFSGKDSGWQKDENGKYIYFKNDEYFGRNIWEEKITDKFESTILFRHLTLQDYFNELSNVGFGFNKLIEPRPTMEQIKLSKRLERLNRIPLFLFLEWKKN